MESPLTGWKELIEAGPTGVARVETNTTADLLECLATVQQIAIEAVCKLEERDAEVERLTRRVAQLEARLAKDAVTTRAAYVPYTSQSDAVEV